MNDQQIHHAFLNIEDVDLLDRVIEERDQMLRHVNIAQLSLSNALDNLLRRQ